MTVLGLRLSRRANAVSALHGEVSRAMWTGLFPGKPEDAVPIGHITNGVHVPIVARAADVSPLRSPSGYGMARSAAAKRKIWEGIENVDDGELWETHLSLKSRMIEFVRRRAVEQAERRGESRGCLATTRTRAQSRRAHHRLCAPLCHLQTRQSDSGRHREDRHHGQRPETSGAIRLCRQGASARRTRQARLQQIAQLMRDPKFADKFVFVEDYDINVGRHLMQGVDVWLNNPRRPLEASGTSGQKVVLNGGLNLSVLDGWWAEAYDGLNGFAIGTGRTHSDMDVHDARDGDDLYRVLREEVIPLYYQRDRDGLPRGWIKRMKRTIRTLGWRFNADRMVMDYTLNCYVPAAGGTSSQDCS